MIYLGSRYQDTPVFYMLDGRTGNTYPTILRNATTTTYSYKSGIWYAGLRMDVLADRTLNDQYSWWRIMDQNDDIIDPMSLVPGMVVALP